MQHSRYLHGERRTAPHNSVRPKIRDKGTRECNRVDSQVPIEIAIFVSNGARCEFFGHTVKGRETILPIVGNAGSKKRPLSRVKHSAGGSIEKRGREAVIKGNSRKKC